MENLTAISSKVSKKLILNSRDIIAQGHFKIKIEEKQDQ
jgi:hypothetical protein